MKKQLLIQPWNVHEELASLGLTLGSLHQAIKYGETERAGCTRNDAGFYAGMTQWSRTLRGLREGLSTEGWACDRSDHVETVLRGDGRVAIAVSMGDEGTGLHNLMPRTKYAKGNGLTNAIAQNNLQLRLGFDAEPVDGECVARVIWVLLIHSAPDEVRCELSIPSAADTARRIDQWSTRIILPAIRHEDPEPMHFADDEDDMEIPISRRAQ